jgi:hypothetical protein
MKRLKNGIIGNLPGARAEGKLSKTRLYRQFSEWLPGWRQPPRIDVNGIFKFSRTPLELVH